MRVDEIADATVPVEFQAAFPDGFERQFYGRLPGKGGGMADRAHRSRGAAQPRRHLVSMRSILLLLLCLLARDAQAQPLTPKDAPRKFMQPHPFAMPRI